LAEQDGFELPVPVVCLSEYFTASLPGYRRKLLLEQYGKAGPVELRPAIISAAISRLDFGIAL
jgi:hypothetical protein